MISYIKSLFNYFYNSNDDDEDREDFLADELVSLEVLKENEYQNENKQSDGIPRDSKCFQRTGNIIEHNVNVYTVILS
jgi:hypothetical protein